MTELRLSVEDYARFVGEVYGENRRPFPWQLELVRRALQGQWPETIAVPTGSGKTSVIDAAIFCMAAMPADQIPLRRIFFVVDRRVVVEEAYSVARHLADRLRKARPEQQPVLCQIAARLRELAGEKLLGDKVHPLEVFQMRGGIYRERAWARSPLQPVVVTTTVDQVGSRLLYRGYGSGPRAWPLQAGLVANDSLIVLDEAHCSKPFHQTITALGRFRQEGEHNPNRPSQIVSMSATPASTTNLLQLGEEDRKPEFLGPRLYASKLAQLNVLSEKGVDQLAQKLVEFAESMEKQYSLKSIGIIVNRVATARKVFEKLKSAKKLILTGRMREPDRRRNYNKFKDELVASPDRPRPSECLYTVATQCIEVGANIDFEGLVTECASLDSLRQRFGRLDRLGLRQKSPARIVIQGDQVQPKEPDPVYKDALPNTWKWLQSIADDGVVDFGIEALKSRLPEDLTELQARSPDAPILLPAYLDRWAQTSPPPFPDPDPALFLHGTDAGRPDVSVVWRSDLRYDLTREEVEQNLSAQLPTSAECAPVPLGQFLRWLAGKDISLREISDLEVGSEPDEDLQYSAPDRKAFLWRGPDDPGTGWLDQETRRRLRPGDVLVVSAVDTTTHPFAEFPREKQHWDLGDVTQESSRRRCAFRLHPELLNLWNTNGDETWVTEVLEDLNNRVDFLEDPERLEHHLQAIQEKSKMKWLVRMAGFWKPKLDRVTRLKESWILWSLRKMPGDSPVSELVQDDSSSNSSKQVLLREHCQGVARLAAGFAGACGLSPRMVKLFELAGALHDVGKADPRFQAWLFGGNRTAYEATGELWAKSDRNQTRNERRRARLRAGYPSGGRHELVSARILADESRLLQDCEDPDLLIHLVASHHGHARPFCPSIPDDSDLKTESYDFQGLTLQGPVRSGIGTLESGQAERFWRLVRKYGWWGLAWLESLLIMADHIQSESERNSDG